MINAERLASAQPEELAAELISVRREVDRLELYFSQLAAAFCQTKLWDAEGYNTSLDWMRINCHLTGNIASSRLVVGENLGRLVESQQAMESGKIGFAHLATLARTAEAVGDVFDETKLLEKARDCSAGKFYYRCQHYRHSVLPQQYAEEQAELTERRQLSLSQCEDGCYLVDGVLDPVAGAAVRNVLEPLAMPSGEFDYRNRGQRLADALLEALTMGGKQRVELQVTSSVETLLGLVGAPGADMEFSLPISSETVKRWACDCSLTRVLMEDSVVIDVGRSKRKISSSQRRALRARDQHCTWPGCERPASWCDVHHIQHWIDDGTNHPDNLTLLCSRHHRMVHEGHWQLVRTDDGRLMPIAPLLTFGASRGPD